MPPKKGTIRKTNPNEGESLSSKRRRQTHQQRFEELKDEANNVVIEVKEEKEENQDEPINVNFSNQGANIAYNDTNAMKSKLETIRSRLNYLIREELRKLSQSNSIADYTATHVQIQSQNLNLEPLRQQRLDQPVATIDITEYATSIANKLVEKFEGDIRTRIYEGLHGRSWVMPIRTFWKNGLLKLISSAVITFLIHMIMSKATGVRDVLRNVSYQIPLLIGGAFLACYNALAMYRYSRNIRQETSTLIRDNVNLLIENTAQQMTDLVNKQKQGAFLVRYDNRARQMQSNSTEMKNLAKKTYQYNTSTNSDHWLS